MKSIIQDILTRQQEHIQSAHYKRHAESAVYTAYEKVKQTLDKEQKEKFEEYINEQAAQQGEEEDKMFFLGFQSGVLLMLEVLGAKI